MATRTVKKLVKCEVCGKEVRSLKGHEMMKHGVLSRENLHTQITGLTVQVADLTSKLAASETKIKEFESKSTPASPALAVLSDVDKKALFGDWLNGLTSDAWLQIGYSRGWVQDAPPVSAAIAHQPERVLSIRRN